MSARFIYRSERRSVSMCCRHEHRVLDSAVAQATSPSREREWRLLLNVPFPVGPRRPCSGHSPAGLYTLPDQSTGRKTRTPGFHPPARVSNHTDRPEPALPGPDQEAKPSESKPKKDPENPPKVERRKRPPSFPLVYRFVVGRRVEPLPMISVQHFTQSRHYSRRRARLAFLPRRVFLVQLVRSSFTTPGYPRHFSYGSLTGEGP
jgi:hypothetical protein